MNQALRGLVKVGEVKVFGKMGKEQSAACAHHPAHAREERLPVEKKKSSRTKRRVQHRMARDCVSRTFMREKRGTVGMASEVTLALGHMQERLWREQRQTDKSETRQTQDRKGRYKLDRDKADTRLSQDRAKTEPRMKPRMRQG